MKPTTSEQVTFFEDKGIRRVYDEQTNTWYFSVVDVVGALTEQASSRGATFYWGTLKRRLKKEGSEVLTNCQQLRLTAEDGKKRLSDVATADVILRIIQTVPSPKAEPIKLWLAQVGYERMQEMADPAIAIDRARALYKQHGRSDKWIEQRMMGQEARNKLTDYWSTHDVKQGQEYAILTNIIHQEWSGLSVKQHKELKGLKSQNLRDHMSTDELVFTALAEVTTRRVAESLNATGMRENKDAAVQGGSIARKAREELEAVTGKRVVTGENFLPHRKQDEE